MAPVLGFASPGELFLLEGTRLPSKTNGIVSTGYKTTPSTFPCTAACIPAVNPEGKQWLSHLGLPVYLKTRKPGTLQGLGGGTDAHKILVRAGVFPPMCFPCPQARLLTQVAGFQL